MGIAQEWCCVCPVHVRMSHATDLGSREFYRMMVLDVVVMKIFSVANGESQKMGCEKFLVTNG